MKRYNCNEHCLALKIEKNSLFRTMTIQNYNRFVSIRREKGVHCTLNIHCNPVGIIGEGRGGDTFCEYSEKKIGARERRRYSRGGFGRNTRFVKRGDI